MAKTYDFAFVWKNVAPFFSTDVLTKFGHKLGNNENKFWYFFLSVFDLRFTLLLEK
jgi:hypothetical protein